MSIHLPDAEITKKIIGCAYTVHNELGAGFLEKVYENALVLELQAQGIAFQRQARILVRFRGQQVGEYVADLLVEGRIICELKAVENLTPQHEIQLVNYLVATGLETGLLINFGPRVTVKRKFGTYTKRFRLSNGES